MNTRFILQAKNNKKITEEGFRQQVIVTVSTIENIYWDLVNAYEDYKVKERSLALAQKTLSDNQKQVEIGTLAPLGRCPRPEQRGHGRAGPDYLQDEP